MKTKIQIITQYCVFYVNLISYKSANICTMQHRGEIIKAAIYKSGISITEIAKRLGKSRRWMYLMFENNSVSLDLVLQIGYIIHHDFSEDIKEFNPPKKVLHEPPTIYEKEEEAAAYWKDKYLKLLEEYNVLLKQK
jgi:predicted transcriptional regulator